MKKSILSLFTFILLVSLVKAQDTTAGSPPTDTIWRTGGLFSLNFSQSYYENWTAGGQNAVTGVAFLKMFANYKKGKWAWDNSVDLAYGLLQERGKRSIKTDDKIQFDSKLGHEISNSWYASMLVNFRTQFAEGFAEDEETVISDFMSPAYLNASLGFDHKPNEHISIFISPASIKNTIVLDQDLANEGAFGVEAAETETVIQDSVETEVIIKEGENIRYEFGAFFKLIAQKELMTNVTGFTRVELYTNYFENFGNIDVNAEALLDFKINEVLSTNLRVELIYDDDIFVQTGTDQDGAGIGGPRTQIKQLFGLGVNVKF